MANKEKHHSILRRKLIRYAVTVLTTIVLMIVLLNYMQSKGQAEYQKNMSLVPLLDEVIDKLDSQTESVEALTRRFHNANQTSVRLVGLFLQSGAFKELQDATDLTSAAAILRNLTANTGMTSIMIVDSEGNLQLVDNADIYRNSGNNLKYNMIKGVNNPSGAFTPWDFKRIRAYGGGWEGTYLVSSDGSGEVSPVKAVIVASDGTTYNGYYYSTPILTEDGKFSGYYLVAMADSTQMEKDISGLTDMSKVLESMGVGNSGFVFSLDPSSGDFIYYRDAEGLELTGESFRQNGITDDILKDGYTGIQEIRGTKYYCVAKLYSSEVFGDKIVIAATLQESELFGSKIYNTFWAVLIFFIIGNLILTYAIIIQVDQIRKGTVMEARKTLFTTKKGKTVYYNRALGLKIFPLLIIGLLIIYGVTVYTQTLSQLSTATRLSESRIKEVGLGVQKNIERSDTVSEFYNRQNLNKTRLLADIIKRAPQVVFDYDMTDAVHYEYARETDGSIVKDQYGNPVMTARYQPNLVALCKAYDFETMYVFNDKGRVVSTSAQWWNFTLSDDPASQSYPFRDVLVNTDYFVQNLMVSDTGKSEQYIGCAFYYYTYNDNGTTCYASEYQYKNGVTADDGSVIVPPSEITRHRGLIQTSVSSQSIEDYITMSTVQYTLDGMKMFYEGSFIAFAKDDTHKILYSPFKEGVTVPVKDAMFSGSFNGYITVDGAKYYACIRESGGIYLGTIIPAKTLFALRNNISLATVIIAYISFSNLLGFMLYSNSYEDKELMERIARIKQEEEEEEDEEDETPAEGSANFDVTMPDGKKKRVKSVQSRWSKRFTEWNKKSVEQKFTAIITGCSNMFFVFVLISVLFARYVFPEGSIMDYIINGNLERSVNIFVMTKSAMMFIVILFVAKIVQRIINVLSSNLGARAETIGHLLESVIKYGGVIGVLFYSLYLLGLNTASLLTSAGILSIVVGLGAQSLISDILAGIFIVFEGEFRVGDIVTVGDFRGTVIEIGIRTTKIEDFLGNIKIFNNSHISGVLNMTKEYSTIPITLSIEYGESLERVEAILKDEFPAIKKKLKSIITGPFYKGVSGLSDNAVNLLVVAQCTEGDRAQLIRDLNRELYLVFNKHGINVPFPQLTLSYLQDEENKKVSIKDHREAERFIAEQKQVSAGVDSPEKEG